jgi:hypothetical protein
LKRLIPIHLEAVDITGGRFCGLGFTDSNEHFLLYSFEFQQFPSNVLVIYVAQIWHHQDGLKKFEAVNPHPRRSCRYHQGTVLVLPIPTNTSHFTPSSSSNLPVVTVPRTADDAMLD